MIAFYCKREYRRVEFFRFLGHCHVFLFSCIYRNYRFLRRHSDHPFLCASDRADYPHPTDVRHLTLDVFNLCCRYSDVVCLWHPDRIHAADYISMCYLAHHRLNLDHSSERASFEDGNTQIPGAWGSPTAVSKPGYYLPSRRLTRLSCRAAPHLWARYKPQ